MLIMTMDNASKSLRGNLTKWLLEPKPNVFVGNVSALVRERLWQLICDSDAHDGALMIFSTNTEQGFHMEMTGNPHRSVVDLDGVQLIKIAQI